MSSNHTAVHSEIQAGKVRIGIFGSGDVMLEQWFDDEPDEDVRKLARFGYRTAMLQRRGPSAELRGHVLDRRNPSRRHHRWLSRDDLICLCGFDLGQYGVKSRYAEL